MFHTRVPWRVLVGVLAVTLCACTGATSSPSSAPPDAAPVKPKVNRLVMATTPPSNESSNPRTIGGTDPFQLRPIFENLIEMDARIGLKYVPGLATEWSFEDNETAIRFKLRKGVPFHFNYGEFTARDIVYTFDSYTGKDDSATQALIWKRMIKKIDVVNDYEVVFHFNPTATLIRMFSSGQAELVMRSKAAAEKEGDPTDLTKGLPGTGPYQFKERAPGAYFRVDRAPYQHWRATPDFPEFEFRWIKEPSTRAAALMAGEVHVTDLPQELQAAPVRGGMKVVRAQVPGLRAWVQFKCCYVDPQTGKYPMFPDAPLHNVKVREALNRAVDREELARAFLPKSEPLYLNHMNPQWPGWDESWEKRFKGAYGYDPARARALLAEAGFTANNHMKLTVILSPNTYIASALDISEALGEQWRRVGIDVTLAPFDGATLAAQGRAYRLDNHVGFQALSFDSIRAIQVNNTNVTPPGTGWFDPKLLSMFNTLIVQMDPKKQEPLLRELGEYGYSNYWDIPLFWVPLEVVINPTIVADWVYPGQVNGAWSHFENMKAAR